MPLTAAAFTAGRIGGGVTPDIGVPRTLSGIWSIDEAGAAIKNGQWVSTSPLQDPFFYNTIAVFNWQRGPFIPYEASNVHNTDIDLTYNNSAGAPATLVMPPVPLFGGTVLQTGVNKASVETPINQPEKFCIGFSDYCIEVWAYSTAATASTIFDMRTTSVNGNYPTLMWSGFTRQPIFFTASATRISGSAISLNTWFHWCVERVGITVTMYINGASVGTYTDGNQYPTSTQITIGNDSFSSARDQPWLGYIGPVRVTRAARYNGAFTVPTGLFPEA